MQANYEEISLCKENIIQKCKYQGNNIQFENIMDFWKGIGAKIGTISKNSDMICLTQECINNLKKVDTIPVDCRIFAFLYSSFNNNGFSFIMHKNCNGIEILVPENCYYLTLSKEINEYIGKKGQGIELKSILSDAQGQWIAKSGNNKYIGIIAEGIKEMSLDDWFKCYSEIVKKKLLDIKYELKYHNANNLDCSIYKQSAYGILSINLKRMKCLLLSMFHFDEFGVSKEKYNYKCNMNYNQL